MPSLPIPSSGKLPTEHPRARLERVPAPPFIKWPGGKRFAADTIAKLVPSRIGRYYEPFMGGAALFFALGGPPATLSDTNQDLADAFQCVRDDPETLIALIHRLRNTESDYYELRRRDPTTIVERAARLLYLVNLSFNGIYRVNLRNEFNVPYGHRSHRPVADTDLLRRASRMLANAEIWVSDFEDAVHDAREGDVVYFDPPYTLAHNNNGFIRYNSRLFSWPDQERLSRLSRRLARGGVHVIVSNADHREVRDLYRGFACLRVSRSSTIAGNPIHRQPTAELIFHNLKNGH